MTFLVDRISYSAKGRKISRPNRVESDRLTIGRSPDNDVRLADLSAALRHAVVQRTGPMRLSVAAEEGLGVELDGRKLTSGVIDLATGGDLRIGRNLLRFQPTPEGAQEIRVEVEEVGESAGEERDRSDVARFSAGAVLPGKRVTAYVLVAAVLALFLAWPLWVYNQRAEAREAQQAQAQQERDPRKAADQRRQRTAELASANSGFAADRLWISGHLSQTHASLENNCAACHVRAFEPVRDEACVQCHTDITNHGDTQRPVREAAQRYARSQPNLTGFARFQLTVAETFGHNPGRCVDCHTEHEGPAQMPVTAQRFCSDCHADLNSRLDGVRFGNVLDFGRNAPQPDAGAHPEFRPLVLIDWNGETPRLERVSLDRNPVENSNLKYPHELHMRPGGGVDRMVQRLRQRYGGRDSLDCSDCHTRTPDGTSFQPVDMEEDCSACHSLGFSQEGGVTRNLRHGSPEQVVADLREFFRGRAPARPTELGGDARRRPGDMGQLRSALQYARARAGANSSATQAIRAVFQPNGACWECHTIDQRGPLDFHVRPVAFPTRYMLHGWFNHASHQRVEWPNGSPSFARGARLEGDQACLSCHTQAQRSNTAANLMLPRLSSCQECHGGEGGSGEQVESGCAMCHDYHLNEGVPAMLLRQRMRGQRWETTVTPVTAAR